METAMIFTPSPIIPVVDERIDIPNSAPEEQQRKIVAYNELLEEIYQRKIELETLEAGLAAKKFEIEDDMAHLALKESGELGNAEKRSSVTAVAAFVPSSRSPPPDGDESEEGGIGAPASGFRAGASIASLRGMVGATRGLKSRGKGKGRQERARMNETSLKLIYDAAACN